MRKNLIFLILLVIRAFTRLFYRHDTGWVGEVPDEPWQDFQVVAILNHTSLLEWLFAGSVPLGFLRRIATHAVVPVADTTVRRPLVGRFFRLIVPHPVEITREADHTWSQVLEHVGSDCMIIIFPEGRMRRANGLDKHGRPMTVRGGIADILRTHPGGRMLLAYSGGLHHVQVPGQTLPRLFKTVRMRFESVSIEEYRESIGGLDKAAEFKRRVRVDLERRRDLYCRPLEEAAGIRYPLPASGAAAERPAGRR